MKLKHRGMLLLLAALLIFSGVAEFRRHGVFPYLNSLHQPVFAAGVIAVGIFVGVLALLPASESIYRFLRGQTQGKHRSR